MASDDPGTQGLSLKSKQPQPTRFHPPCAVSPVNFLGPPLFLLTLPTALMPSVITSNNMAFLLSVNALGLFGDFF